MIGRLRKVIAFDADDTLWENESLFRAAEAQFIAMLSEYEAAEYVEERLFEIECGNMPYYGYGVMPFMLSMLETAAEIAKDSLSPFHVQQIKALGKSILDNPAKPFERIEEILEYLGQKGYRLFLLTKGELTTQEAKVRRSGLARYFEHIEVMSDKKKEDYQRILFRQNVDVEDFMMIGNSFRSDISPVLELGAKAIYVPSQDLWRMEVQEEYESEHLKKCKNIEELCSYIKKNL